MATCGWRGALLCYTFRKELCGWKVKGQGSQKAQSPGWLGPTVSDEGSLAASTGRGGNGGESPERILR